MFLSSSFLSLGGVLNAFCFSGLKIYFFIDQVFFSCSLISPSKVHFTFPPLSPTRPPLTFPPLPSSFCLPFLRLTPPYPLFHPVPLSTLPSPPTIPFLFSHLNLSSHFTLTSSPPYPHCPFSAYQKMAMGGGKKGKGEEKKVGEGKEIEIEGKGDRKRGG